MKKLFFLAITFSLILSACLPAQLQPQATSPAPNLAGTAAVFAQQTLESLPTQTLAPSETPVVMTSTETPTQPTPTETQNPVLLTLTATLGTGTVPAGGEAAVPGDTALPVTTTPSATVNPAISVATTTTAHPQHYGTMPPYLPFGQITLINKSKREVYISLQCTTSEGYTTIIEYPVGSKKIKAKAPAGKYTYVAWVGGNQLIGNFRLEQHEDITINIFKDQIQIK